MAATQPIDPGLSRKALDEQQRIEMELEKETRARPSTFGCLLRGLLMVTLFAILLLGGLYFGIRVWIGGYKAQLDAKVKAIRERGDPLTPEDMANFNKLPEGTNDLTERYLRIVKNYYSGSRQLAPGEDRLPHVGANAKGDVPHAGQPWPDEAIATNYMANRPWLLDADELAEEEGDVMVPRDYGKGFSLLLEDVQAVRGLARDLKLRFQMQMRNGDRDGALRSLRTMFRISELVRHDPILIAQLVRIATHAIAVQSSTEFLRDRQATAGEVADLREMLRADFRASLLRALKGERATGLITLTTNDFNQLNGAIGNGSGPAMPSIPIASPMADLRPGDTAKLLEMLTESIELVEENDVREIVVGMQKQETKLKDMIATEQTKMPWNRHMLPQLLLPALSQASNAFAREWSMEAALRIALDVEEKMGALPPEERTIAAESALIESLVPIDPFSGQPLRFLVNDEGYKIYTVGPNGVDDTAAGGNQDLDFGVWIERKLSGSKPATQTPSVEAAPSKE